MDTRTRTASPTADDEHVVPATPPPVQDKISAYYSLVFPHFTFYIQTLSITIGRRCAANAATSSTADNSQVDVDLGALKSVSRLHAKIEYDQEEDRFVLVVIGRNGAWVDGVWSGAGTRAPLSERSLIQIASRTFHFVLPPPPPPEDTPSPSSQSSAHRARSPSLDITSISPPTSQPSHSPPPKRPPPSPEPQVPPKPKPKAQVQPQSSLKPELPNTNTIGKSAKANSKKRKKSDVDPPPVVERVKPEVMPPKPPFTYAQLIFRAITEIGGKATLQEICTWIMNTHEYYRYADGAWMSSVRHNLSSGRAFIKGERCGGDRGKGFFWSVDEQFVRTLEEQELKVQQAAAAAAQGIVPGGESASRSRKKDKNVVLEPALKRSVKGDVKGAALPPPLTSVPLSFKGAAVTQTSPPVGSSSNTSTAATGVFAYPTHPHTASSVTPGYGVNSYPSVVQPNWNQHSLVGRPGAPVPPTVSTTPAPAAGSSVPPQQSGVPDVNIPIVLGPIPPTHPDYAPGNPNNSAKEGYMVLHERKLILDPSVFAELTADMLEQLEKMGAPTALSILTNHMIRALKERRARERGKDRGARPKKKKVPNATTPFTKVPLDQARKVSVGSLDTANPTVVQPTMPAPPSVDPGSPIIVVDELSDEEGPAVKKRKVEDALAMSVP